jgi:type VI secretion system secreted protein VgrG
VEQLALTFASGESSLDVRSFATRERISEPFVVDVVARSASPDVDFEPLIGRAASLVVRSGLATIVDGGVRTWSGICVHAAQTRVEDNGLSTYELRIVPRLGVLAERRNHRLFQHQSAVDILETLTREWQVPIRLELDPARYPCLELSMQYGESDLAFLGRLLETAGISYYFEPDDEHGTVTVFSDEPQARQARTGPLGYVDQVEQAQGAQIEYCTAVRVSRRMKPGRVVLRDFDFRKPRYELMADASVDDGVEQRLEQYRYVPGAFKTEGHAPEHTPAADDLGVARADPNAGMNLATRLLQSERARRRIVTFETNAYDVGPGTTVRLAGHPRTELASADALLTVGLEMRGKVGEAWVAEAEAVFIDTPFRPAIVTEKPRVTGVQSAIVVGPEEETVHTDEFGRVRVQFHWDRQGDFDPNSSCWMRVSQGWAGPGYGLFNLPRVGHEVLVGFVDGDADQPIIVGRVFNGAQKVPYSLPGSRMMSGWKSDSNSNIILFDDTPGDEMFYEQAERNRLGIVKRNEAYLTGGSRTTYLGTAERTLVRTTATRVALGNHKTLCGITSSDVAAISWKAQAGFGATIKAGRKFEANVTPVMPFLTALRDVNDAKIAIFKKLPNGSAPDLQQVLPSYAGGQQPAQPDMADDPPMSQQETEDALKNTLKVVGEAVAKFEPEEVEAMADASDLDTAVDKMLGSLQSKGGDAAMSALASAKQLTAQLEKLTVSANANAKMKPKAAPPSPIQQEEQTGPFELLLAAIIEMVLPKTKIEITHQKIKIHTEKASVELDGEDIKLEAKGDISIKADGTVSIEGASVRLNPNPC